MKNSKKELGNVTEIKPYTTKELANMYEVDRRTFSRWIRPYNNAIGVRIGFYYTVLQVQEIFKALGLPGKITEL